MLRRAKALGGYKLRARDGDIGKVNEFYFDDASWAVRYLVADTGNWLSGRLVLISPHALDSANDDGKIIPVDLTKKQIEDSPSLDTDRPVSRRYESSYFRYYGWPMYWYGPYMWGPTGYPARDRGTSPEPARHEDTDDPHLRSTRDVSGHHLHAQDGEIGHVEDFVIDDETWAIRYLVIDTRNWWPGKKILVSPHWIDRVSWSDAQVVINLPRETIKQAPAYTEGALISRAYEAALHRHYHREGYWAGAPAGQNEQDADGSVHARA